MGLPLATFDEDLQNGSPSKWLRLDSDVVVTGGFS
jgi:hypothetical protein